MNKIETLDYIKNIQLDKENPPLDNIHALNYIPHGLLVLAQTVRSREMFFTGKVKPKEGENLPFDAAFIANCFHWFGVSLVNYVRLVALIEVLNSKNWRSSDLVDKANAEYVSKTCREYCKEVIPEVFKWRNKIAAHFAVTDPFINNAEKDNIATLEYSVMMPVSYMKPYYEVGGFKWFVNG